MLIILMYPTVLANIKPRQFRRTSSCQNRNMTRRQQEVLKQESYFDCDKMMFFGIVFILYDLDKF